MRNPEGRSGVYAGERIRELFAQLGVQLSINIAPVIERTIAQAFRDGGMAESEERDSVRGRR